MALVGDQDKYIDLGNILSSSKELLRVIGDNGVGTIELAGTSWETRDWNRIIS